MNRIGLLLAIALVVVGNAFVFIGVRSNRAGAPLETIELTERELVLQSQPEDNTGVTLQINWWPRYWPGGFDREKLQDLGFRCPSPSGPGDFERRMSPRAAYVALEYQGPAWERWLKEQEAAAAKTPPPITAAPSHASGFDSGTRLFFVDAALDPDKLMRRYSDRRKYLIVRAVVAARFTQDKVSAGSWHGWVAEIIPSEIHVPLPFASLLSGLSSKVGEETRYTVTLQYGRHFEPWVSDVKLLGK
ncbi:MAG TPA: DUF4824 family protein [Acidobacteriota bacterium]|nr:DUF4824 family protein [Acidobacteriota bacterium]